MAKLERESYIPKHEPTGDFLQDMYAEFDAMGEESAAAEARYIETGNIVGCYYQQQFADGYAFYKVTKARPLTVAHVAVGDAWQLPPAHIRGLNADDIRASIERNIGLREIFS